MTRDGQRVIRTRYLSDVLPHPVQDLPLVQQPGVEVAIPTHMLARQKPQRAHAVVEVDEHEAVARLRDDFGAVVVCVCVLRVAAALDVHPDGEVGLLACARRLEDVDEEAVFCVGGVGGLADGDAGWAELNALSKSYENCFLYQVGQLTCEAS